jgi:hypothetical protein
MMGSSPEQARCDSAMNRRWHSSRQVDGDNPIRSVPNREDRLVVRKDLSGRLRYVQYYLSDSMGFAVLDLISTLTEWGREYLPYEPNRAGVGSALAPRTPNSNQESG